MDFCRSALFDIETRVFLKDIVHDCLWKQCFLSNLPQAPSNVICLTILGTLTHIYPKLRTTNLLKTAKAKTTFSFFSPRSKFGIEKFSSLV